MAEPPTWAIVADYATRLGEAEKQAKKQADDTHRWWVNFVALLPYAVPVEKTAVIPMQRTAPDREVDLWPRAVVQDRGRFLDTRNT